MEQEKEGCEEPGDSRAFSDFMSDCRFLSNQALLTLFLVHFHPNSRQAFLITVQLILCCSTDFTYLLAMLLIGY